MTLTTSIDILLPSVAVAGVLWVFIVVVSRIWFHPLSSYPGPWLSKFTDLPRLYAAATHQRTFHQYELVKKYGTPVRAGPNNLVFIDIPAWAEIYGQSSNPCLKDGTVYDGLTATGPVNILSVNSRSVHSRLRRLVAHSFSAKALLESEPMIHNKINDYLQVTVEGSDGGSLDILQKTFELYLDIVSQLSFGRSFNCLNGENPNALKDVRAFFEFVPPCSFVPGLRYMPIKALQEGLRGVRRLENFSRTHLEAYLSRSAEKREAGPEGKFLHNLATAEDAETGSILTMEELVENSIIFLTAGSGTTASTTLYLIWECGKQSEVRKKLISEIREAFPDEKVMPTYEKASKLPYLDNMIKETLRLWGPLNVGCSRISPGKSLAGRWIPKGVVVETSPYATHRDPSVFPDPFNFVPSRWENPTRAMTDSFWPFSMGPRNCVGRHLAQIGITLAVARLYQLYDLVPDPSMTEEEMQQVDKGVLEPGCKRFLVIPTRHTRSS